MWLKKRRFHAKKTFQAIDRFTAVAEIGVDGRIQEVSDRFCDLLGYQRAELIGQPKAVFFSTGVRGQCCVSGGLAAPVRRGIRAWDAAAPAQER